MAVIDRRRRNRARFSSGAPALTVLLGLVAALWLVEVVDASLPVNLDRWGIRPRSRDGLVGILAAPFLHDGFHHLALNTLPLVVLGALVALRGQRAFLRISTTVVLTSGAALWIFGRAASNHIGASGLVFGYFGFLVTRVLFERRFGVLLVAALTVALYGTVILSGLMPSSARVSWEGHLCGLVAGCIAAWVEPPSP